MKLGTKLHLIIGLFTLIVIILVGFIVLRISNRSYYEIEEGLFQSELSSLNEVIQGEFNDLDYILNDWALWDATYEYVQGNDANYLSENLQEGIFNDLNLAYIYILDDENKVLYGKRLNPETEEQELIDKETMALLISDLSDTGIVQLNNNLYLYATKAVSNNDGVREPLGRMGFLRHIDDKFIESLEKRTNLSLDYYVKDVSDDTLPNKKVPLEFRTELDHSKQTLSTITVSIPMTNSYAAFAIRSKLRNLVQILGLKYAKETLLILFVTLALFGIALNIAFNKFVLKRLINLIQQVSRIRNSGNTEDRLNFHGKDEIGILSENINVMLSELDRIHKEVKYFATFDEMTGVFNRRVGYDILSECIRNKAKNGIDFSIVYIDIDGLKKVNDNFGHNMGDALIEDVVQIIKSVQDNMHLVRLGGDEFLAILKNTTFMDAEKYKDQLLEATRAFNKVSERIYTVSFSIGCIQYDDQYTIEEFLEIADQKMYAEKSEKRNP